MYKLVFCSEHSLKLSQNPLSTSFFHQPTKFHLKIHVVSEKLTPSVRSVSCHSSWLRAEHQWPRPVQSEWLSGLWLGKLEKNHLSFQVGITKDDTVLEDLLVILGLQKDPFFFFFY